MAAAPTGRRAATSPIPGPQIAEEMARTLAACTATVDALRTGGRLGLSDAATAAGAALASSSIGTHRDVVLDALSAAAHQHTLDLIVEARHDLAGLTGADVAALTDTAGIHAALTGAGIDVPGLSPAALAGHRRLLAVRAVERLQDLHAFADWVRGGALREALADAWDSAASFDPLEQVIAAAGAAGVDGERLAWDVISFEMHKHIRLIWHQANKIAPRLPDRTPADLLGWGWIGLRLALRNYDPDLGFRFSTYACAKIAGSILDGVRSEHHLPKRLTTYQRRISRAEDDLSKSLGRIPTLAEIADHMGEDLAELSRLKPRLASSASLEELTDPAGEHASEPSCLIDSQDPAEEATTAVRHQALLAAVSRLGSEDAQIIRMVDLEERPVAEVAAALGTAPRALRVRRAKALASLREELAAWDPALAG